MPHTAITLDQTIAEQHWIDRAADPIQRTIEPLVHSAPAVARTLHGDWLGHPLHAALTDVPVGAWFTALVLDIAHLAGASRKLRRGADTAITIGLAGSMAAAITGLADWSTTRDDAKRIGFVHGATNSVIAALYGASLLARRRKHRALGIALSTTGYGLLVLSAWLGGQLSYRLGVGVRSEARLRGNAEEQPPTDQTTKRQDTTPTPL